jgi:hypothetical protein
MSNIVEPLRNPMIESYSDRLKAADEIEKLRKALADERSAILELIESYRADGHLYARG